MGGTSSAFACFVMPAAFAIKIGLDKESKAQKIGIWSLAVGGTVVGVLSTGVTVYSMFT